MKPRSTKKGRKYQRTLNNNPYIDGVIGVDGKIAIRPLTEEEFEFLKKFNDEFVEGNFKRDSTDLHYTLIQESENEVKDLKERIKELGIKLRENNGYRMLNDRKAYSKYKKNLYKEYEELKEKLKEVDIMGNVEKGKHARRNDMMTYTGKGERTVAISDLFNQGSRNTEYTSTESQLFEYLEGSKI